MVGNYPNGVSENTPHAPWNQGVDDDKLICQQKVELLEKAQTYLGWLTEVLEELKQLDHRNFFYHIERSVKDNPPWDHDRMWSLRGLSYDLIDWTKNLTPTEEEPSCDPES